MASAEEEKEATKEKDEDDRRKEEGKEERRKGNEEESREERKRKGQEKGKWTLSHWKTSGPKRRLVEPSKLFSTSTGKPLLTVMFSFSDRYFLSSSSECFLRRS